MALWVPPTQDSSKMCISLHPPTRPLPYLALALALEQVWETTGTSSALSAGSLGGVFFLSFPLSWAGFPGVRELGNP